jgi:hypothetical protein
MIHLESGTCESRTYCGLLDDLAYECYQSDDYTNGWTECYKYKCPACLTRFRYLSALFQHVESDACDQDFNGSIGKLEFFISIRI